MAPKTLKPAAFHSQQLWQDRFGADPNMLERRLRLNNREFAVIGVAERGFTGTTIVGADLWVPIAMIGTIRGENAVERLTNPRQTWHKAVGRLRADVSQLLQGHLFSATRERLRIRHGLVVAQVALSLAIVITAGLFVRSLRAASHIDSGYKTDNVEIVSIDTTLAGATGQRAVALMEQVVERIRSVPGVETVGHGRMIPLQGGSFALGGVRVPGLDEATAARLSDTNWDVVSPDYFRTVGLPILNGRPFDGRDRDGQPRVAIVNETFARLAWPDRPAIGQRFWQIQSREDAGQPVEVIGVVKDAKNRTIAEGVRPFVSGSMAIR